VPLFEIGDNELVPFRRVKAGPQLYEEEIEGGAGIGVTL
jgi:hypothetical protein